MKNGDDQKDLTSSLVEVQPGIYTFDVPDLWPGTYIFNANVTTPDNALADDFAWQATSASHTLVRIWSSGFILATVMLIALIVGSIVLVIFIILHDRRLREYPLHGSISVIMRPSDPRMPGTTELATFNLDAKTRNRQVFRQKQLPKPLEYLVVSTQRTEHNSENGYAVIEALRLNGRDSEKVGRILHPGGEPVIIGTSEDGENEYVLTKDVSYTAAFDFLTAAKK
jgi:hypothetical protein